MNSCALANIIVLAIALLGASLLTDATDKQIAALQGQNKALQDQLIQMQADAVNDARDAKKAALVAEETARIKLLEVEALKKSLLEQKKSCK